MRATRLRCWLTSHEPFLRQKRGTSGLPVVPHVLVWECARCGGWLGETTIPIPEEKRLPLVLFEIIDRMRARIRYGRRS